MTNHLLESTLFAALIGLLTFAFRNNPARVRHWLWLAASVKFLIPFSLLVGIGSHFGFRTAAPSQVTYVGEQVSRQLPAPQVDLVPSAPVPIQWPVVGAALWIGGCVVVLLLWGVRWRRVRAAMRAATPIRMTVGVSVMSSPALLEPGVFGIWRPALLLPEGIEGRLTEAQLDAVVAHELCHVRRGDNLVAAIHMMVEALFWFHPLVWWIGARMVEERERACDEEVLRLGKKPEVYAEGILKVCRFYVESPIECVARVTGSNLKKRIEEIMTRRIVWELDAARKFLLTVTAFAAIAGPVAIGALNAPARAQAQPEPRPVFEVASVKATKSDTQNFYVEFAPNGRFTARGVPLLFLVSTAYNVPFQGPRLKWADRKLIGERYDIEATAEPGAIPAEMSRLAREAKMKLMLQKLLEDRFKMEVLRETKVMPVYAVIVGKNGPKLTQAKIEEKDCPEPGHGRQCHQFAGGMGRGLHSEAINMEDLVEAVSNWADRPVVNRTGLDGLFAIDTEGWVPMQPRQGGGNSDEDKAISDPARPTLYMIFDRLGLKMESSTGPTEMITVLHVEKPSDN